MEARGIDVLVGAGYVNYGYVTGYFTHFGRDPVHDHPRPMSRGRVVDGVARRAIGR